MIVISKRHSSTYESIRRLPYSHGLRFNSLPNIQWPWLPIEVLEIQVAVLERRIRGGGNGTLKKVSCLRKSLWVEMNTIPDYNNKQQRRNQNKLKRNKAKF